MPRESVRILDQRIREAQATGDTDLLAEIYTVLGKSEIANGRIHEGAFFLVQAYVYALEAGSPCAKDIHAILKAHGREE